MKTRRAFLGGAALLGATTALAGWRVARAGEGRFEVAYPEEKWREILTPEEFAVLREEETEPPFTSDLLGEKRKGSYVCAGCDNPLYSSETKFESGTGWPSFWAPIAEEAVGYRTDWKLIFPRQEVHCARCGGHQGHVFDDGPPPTGKRHCINGVALNFKPADEASPTG